MRLSERIERADFGQTIQLVLTQLTDAHGEIVHAAEGPLLAGAQDRLAGIFAESAHIAESQAKDRPIGMFDRAIPVRLHDVDRQDAQSVALGILN